LEGQSWNVAGGTSSSNLYNVLVVQVEGLNSCQERREKRCTSWSLGEGEPGERERALEGMTREFFKINIERIN